MSTLKGVILGVIITLLCIGMVAVFSASSSMGRGSAWMPKLAQRHSVWMLLALIAVFAGSRVDYHALLKHSRWLLILAFAALAACAVPAVRASLVDPLRSLKAE